MSLNNQKRSSTSISNLTTKKMRLGQQIRRKNESCEILKISNDFINNFKHDSNFHNMKDSELEDWYFNNNSKCNSNSNKVTESQLNITNDFSNNAELEELYSNNDYINNFNKDERDIQTVNNEIIDIPTIDYGISEIVNKYFIKFGFDLKSYLIELCENNSDINENDSSKSMLCNILENNIYIYPKPTKKVYCEEIIEAAKCHSITDEQLLTVFKINKKFFPYINWPIDSLNRQNDKLVLHRDIYNKDICQFDICPNM
jgi:hypothetical protein